MNLIKNYKKKKKMIATAEEVSWHIIKSAILLTFLVQIYITTFEGICRKNLDSCKGA